VRWTWDPEKEARNLKKHGVSFDLAARVFRDPFAVTVPNSYQGEERWQTIGMPSAETVLVLLVVHTWPEAEDGEGEGRIISARRAAPRERRVYEEGQS